jgi:uncharacterized C2H2 Zn-finger protein
VCPTCGVRFHDVTDLVAHVEEQHGKKAKGCSMS